nr:CDP-glycerol--glycerophosphate glycerophosphotransferase [Treponema sp.]
FDYTLLCDRPIIYADTKFDPRPYDAGCLDHPMWRFEILKDLGIKLDEKDFPDIKTVIEKTIKSENLAQGRAKAKAQAWMHIGESAKRTVDFLESKYNEINSKNNNQENK